MSKPMLLGMDMLRRIQSVRPDRLVSLFPQNEPVGHGVSTEIVRGYHGAYTATNLGQPGVQGSGLTSAGYDGAASFNNIYTAGLANDNLLLNPGFETAGGAPPVWANWVDNVSDGALANEVVVIHEGTDAAKVTAGVSFDTRITQPYVSVPGTRMRIRFWTQGDGVNAGMYYVYDNTNAAPIVATVTTGVTGAAYGMVATEFTVPAGCASIDVGLQCPPVNGGICYYDACEVRRIDGFLGDKGTIIVPAQVANAGVWTDGVDRRILTIQVDAENRVYITRSPVNNEIQFVYEAGNVLHLQATGGLANLDYAFYGITWDIAAGATGEVRYYIRGVPSGATDVGLGTWVGDINATRACIGVSITTPSNIWSGNIGPVPVWSEALTPDEMRYLGT